MVEDVTVVIRSSNEATEPLCHDLISKQVNEDSIFLINETPFNAAVIKTFEFGISAGTKWTLAVDADVLLFDNSVGKLIKWAEQFDDSFFEFQGRVFDKFFCSARPGGPHLYRTEHLEKALRYIPKDPSILRPESTTYNKMAEDGHHFYHDLEVYGVHDFMQYYRDIYRKCYIHGIKHNQYLQYFLRQWVLRSKNDPDYIFAIRGILDGISGEDTAKADLSYFENNTRNVHFFKELDEKEPVLLIEESVEDLIHDFEKDNESIEFEITRMNFHLRSDQGIGKVGSSNTSLLKKVIGKLGDQFNKTGSILKRYSKST